MTMDAETAEALEASIKHWRENVEIKRFDHDAIGPSRCALCEMFFHQPDKCKGCPVAARTRTSGCYNTPYDNIVAIFEDWQIRPRSVKLRDAFRTAARAELAFLESLRDQTS